MGKLYEENWYKKWQKEAILGKFPRVYRYRYKAVPILVQGCTGTAHQRLTCTGTGPTCTGTGQQNATCTGTGQRCTGTSVPKMPRMLCFCKIKPEFVHQ